MHLGGRFSREAAATNFHECKAADVAVASPGVIIDRGRVAIRTAHHGKNVMRLHSGHPNMKGRVWESASPLPRQFQVESLVGVWEAKMASGSRAAATALKAVA